MKITLRQLEILQAISVAGSIGRATRRLGMSQPNISQQLAKMEEALGVQLLVRGRSLQTELTPAGEFWAASAARILASVEAAEASHDELFLTRGLNLAFGTTPSLTGRFTETVAKVAAVLPRLSRFELVFAMNSTELAEMLMMHRINVAVLSADGLRAHQAALHMVPLFRDRIVWAVPAAIPEAQTEAMLAGAAPQSMPEALLRYVDMGQLPPWHAKSRNWYQGMLPDARPFFASMTHESAVRIVAAGLATCHTPASLIHNLPLGVRARVRFYELAETAREVVLAMPRHLNSVRPFHDFALELATRAREAFVEDALDLQPLPVPPASARAPKGAA